MPNGMPYGQHYMCESARSAPSKRWAALCEIQEGPNPLTRAELEKQISLHPNRADAYIAWLNGHPDWP